jgi:hypothetical protein
MFEKTSRLAEQAVSSLSRRGFLGSVGGWAATAALGVGGMLSGSATALASYHCPGKCCQYRGFGSLYRVQQCKDCPPTWYGYALTGCVNNAPNGATCLC